MNQAQRRVIAIGFFLIAAIGLFPMKMAYHQEYRQREMDQRVPVWVFSISGDHYTKFYDMRVDIIETAFEWVVVAAGTAGTVLFVGAVSRKRRPDGSAASNAKEPVGEGGGG